MAQARDEAGNIWEVDAQGNPVRLIQAAQAAPQRQAPQVTPLDLPPPPPPPPPSRTTAGAATEGLKPGFMWVDPNNPAAGQVKVPTTPATGSPQSNERRAQIKTILGTVQRIRKMADESLAVGSAAEFLQGVPVLNQNNRNVQASIEQLRGDIIQQQLAILAEANQGGVASLANSISEAERMAASIAPLNAAQSLPEFMQGLQNAEDYYLRQAAALDGKPAPDAATMEAFLPEERRKEIQSAAAQPQQMALSGDSEAVPVPQWYRESVARYLAENKGNLDPSQYAAFRRGLDQQAGIPGDIAAYVDDGARFREFMAKGGKPEDIELQQTYSQSIGGVRGAISDFAGTPIGAATVSYANSATAGLPGLLTGQQEQIEAVRQANPGMSMVGDIAGGITGTMMTGAGLGRMGVQGLAANPMVQNAMFSGVSGATQSEDPLLGAAIGVSSSLAGDVAGRYIGQAFPETFAGKAMQRAEESVPTVQQLKDQAREQYRAVEAAGSVAQPDDTLKLAENLAATLRREGRITPAGDLIDENTPITKGYKLISDFAGQPMTPQQAGAVRDVLSEGRMTGTPNERRIASKLVEDFDQWATPTLPGIEVPRATSQRYLQGQAIQERNTIGNIRGQRAKGNDVGDSVRTQFGQLDEAIERGDEFFTPPTREAIALAARGDGLTNTLRNVGKYGFGSVLPTSGLAAGTLGAVSGQTDPLLMGIPLAVGSIGTASRALAQQRTLRAAQDAELTALGGPQYQAMLKQAREEAAIRAGRVGSGIFGSAAVRPFMD